MHFLMNLNRFSDKIRKRNCVLHDARLDRKQKNTTTFCSYYVFYFLPLNISNTVYNFTTLLSLFKIYITYNHVKFIYSEKATNICEIFPLLLIVCTVVKSKGKISQNFGAFSQYMNFNSSIYHQHQCAQSFSGTDKTNVGSYEVFLT